MGGNGTIFPIIRPHPLGARGDRVHYLADIYIDSTLEDSYSKGSHSRIQVIQCMHYPIDSEYIERFQSTAFQPLDENVVPIYKTYTRIPGAGDMECAQSVITVKEIGRAEDQSIPFILRNIVAHKQCVTPEVNRIEDSPASVETRTVSRRQARG